MVTNKKLMPTDAPAGERFFQALRDLRDAELLRQLDECITELTSAVMETGGKGHLTLKVAVSKLGKDRQVGVKPTLSRSIPQEETRLKLLYADEQGRFCVDDPAQGQFDFDAPRKVNVTSWEIFADGEETRKVKK
ncbi:MAG: hypothetical protein IKZ07_05995 [Akkermansia sp.]|nr:hypothetical protein [Akkermansia sp.]